MSMSASAEALEILARLGVPESAFVRGGHAARSPITGETMAELVTHSVQDVGVAIGRADKAFREWRLVPAPRRGEFVRLLGEELRAAKTDLGRLVTLEVGKINSEGLGEVQEMIDICDYAVGLSRQLFGLTIATERPSHRMMETWHPLGVCGVISAFNFPVAVWSWNAALALVCGDSVVWKPSEKSLLTALATQAIFHRAAKKFGGVPDGLLEVLAARDLDRGEQTLARQVRETEELGHHAVVGAHHATADAGAVGDDGVRTEQSDEQQHRVEQHRRDHGDDALGDDHLAAVAHHEAGGFSTERDDGKAHAVAAVDQGIRAANVDFVRLAHAFSISHWRSRTSA